MKRKGIFILNKCYTPLTPDIYLSPLHTTAKKFLTFHI